jgi:hypothetical protein
MKRTLSAIFLSICLLFWSTTGAHAENVRTNEEKRIEKVKISDEDRQVIRMMELLTMMDFLKDMELMEGQKMAGTEDEK